MRLCATILLAAVIFIAGCGSVISKNVLREADRSISLPLVQSNPDAFKGRMVIWGGAIISSENLEDSTVIEVLDTELYYDDTPDDGESRGRFLVEAKRFLDTAIFKPGKMITVAGKVQGVSVRKIGKMDYAYPVIEPVEIRLFEQPPRVEYLDMPPPWWYGPMNPPFYYGPAYPYNPYYQGPYPQGHPPPPAPWYPYYPMYPY